MILIIPEIKLTEGRCLLSIKGEEDTERLYSTFSSEPDQMCCLLRRENAKSIHITIDDENLKEEQSRELINLTKSVDIPIQLSANFCDIAQCEELLSNGVFRIFICLLSNFNSNDIKYLVEKYTPSRICSKVEVFDGKIRCDKIFDISVPDFLNQMKDIGIQRVLYKDRNIIEKGKKYDLDVLKEYAINSRLKFTLYDGIKGAEDLWRLNDYLRFGIDSVVLGEALFDNYFPCQKIWRMAEAELEVI